MTASQENVWNHQNVLLRRLGSIADSQRLRTVLGFIAFEIAYYFAYSYAMAFSQALPSPLWFPDSVLLCALLRSRRDLWWLFILGAFPIRLFAGAAQDPQLWYLLAVFANDSIKALLAAFILRRFMKNPLRFETIRDFAVFGVFAVLLIPAASAFAGAAGRQALGADFWPAWTQWFMGDALAQLVVTPAILYWVFAAPWKAKALDGKRLGEAAVVAAGLVLAGYWCFSSGEAATFADPRFYAPVPFLFWAALRFGMPGASGAIAIIAAFAVAFALDGSGPFSHLPPAETAFALQNFLLLRAAPLYLVATLIEQVKSAERTLQESEERFRNMANSAPVLLWMSGTDKLGVFFNQAWLNFTGRTLEQELGDGWAASVHPDDIQHCLDVCHTTFDTRQPFEVEYRLRRHDGEYRWVHDVGTPRRGENGAFLGYVGSAFDITDRKRNEESTRALAQVQRLAILGELTAAIAHELRQPLTVIMSNAEAALRLLKSPNPLLGEIHESISDICKADIRANEVLGNIQDFLRKQETEMQLVDVNAAVSDVVHFLAGDIRNRSVRIRTELAAGLPPVLGNRTQLQQVLINLIVNAMDAMATMPETGRHLAVRTKSNSGGDVEVAVTDCGCGIAPDKITRLFESFFTTRKDGMGLGLSIARSIVESHRGRIWAVNNPGNGATFSFTVPLAGRKAAIPCRRKPSAQTVWGGGVARREPGA